MKSGKPTKENSTNPMPHLAAGIPASGGQLILHRRARLLKMLHPDPGGLLLDFGCGNGAQTLLLADSFDQIYGVDINESFLKGYQDILRNSPLNSMTSLLATGGQPVDLPSDCIDLATSFTVLEHVPDEKPVLKDLHRLLKPDGKLMVTVPNRWWIFETHGANLPLLPWNRVPFVSWWPKKLHDRFARARIYQRAEICKLVQEAGFKVDEVFYMTAPLDVIKWAPLRNFLRKTLFRGDRSNFPFMATEIVVFASKEPLG